MADKDLPKVKTYTENEVRSLVEEKIQEYMSTKPTLELNISNTGMGGNVRVPELHIKVRGGNIDKLREFSIELGEIVIKKLQQLE